MTPYDGNYRPEDQKNEDRISKLISERWKCDLVRQGHYENFDFIGMRGGEILSFVEVRCRSHDYGDFPDCFISLTKLLKANELTQTTGLPCFFIVSWKGLNETIGWINLGSIQPKLVRSGKKWSRRENPEISELLGSIPIDKFIKFD